MEFNIKEMLKKSTLINNENKKSKSNVTIAAHNDNPDEEQQRLMNEDLDDL